MTGWWWAASVCLEVELNETPAHFSISLPMYIYNICIYLCRAFPSLSILFQFSYLLRAYDVAVMEYAIKLKLLIRWVS